MSWHKGAIRNIELSLENCKSIEEKIVIVKQELKDYGNKLIHSSIEADFIASELRILLERLEATKSDAAKKPRVGLNSMLTYEQKKTLFYKIENKFIYGSLDDFVAALTRNKLPKDYNFIKWLPVSERGRNAKGVNKKSLREFLEYCKIEVIPSDISHLFKDINGEGIMLPKRKKEEYSNYAEDISKLFDSL